MEKLIEFLNSGETLAFVGSGVAREVGLPTWMELTQGVFERIPENADAKTRQGAERLLKQQRYPEFMGWIARNLGEGFLYSACRELLKDTGTVGRVNDFIAKFPFKSVFTTNFDDSLKRHFDRAGRATSTYLNTRQDLEAVDIDSIRCIVKLHSDLDHSASIVLTDSQYAAIRSAGELEFFRQFVKSYLTNRRFLIVGYSVTDPDIQLLLENIALNLRRKTPIYAIIADAPPETCSQFKTLYNIEVIPYQNRSGDHSELAALFQAMSRFVTEFAPRLPSPELNLKRAQSLYLWSRFGLSDDAGTAHIDSLKSLVLAELKEAPRSLSSVQASIEFLVGLSDEVVRSAVASAVDSLKADGLIELDGELLKLTSSSAELVAKATEQHRRLQETFLNQVKLDLQEQWTDVSPEQLTEAARLAADTLVDVFDERGVEVVNAMFDRADSRSYQSANLFATLARRGSELGSDELRYKFVSYMVDLISNPREAERAYLEHLALTFFSIHALAMDPEGHRFRQEFLAGRTLLVDSNVLIPLLPISGTFQSQMKMVVERARDQGIPLVTTESFVDEVYRHGSWAIDLIKVNGEESVEVLQAARGEGFKQNAFIDGFVLYSVTQRKLSFQNYLSTCIGGEFTRANIAKYLNEQFSIRVIDFQQITNKNQQAFVDRDETEAFIQKQAEESQIDKSETRIKAEAEAYAIVANWDMTKPDDLPAEPGVIWDIAFLSQGGFLNRIARYGPRPLGKYVVVPPETLYGFLLRIGLKPALGMSFRELMVSPLFDTGSHFIDKAKYRQFFGHLINDADRIFAEHLETFQAEIDSALRPEFLDDVDPLDRPYFSKALQVQLEQRLAEKDAKIAEKTASEENLKSKLSEADRQLAKQARELRTVQAIILRKAWKQAEQQKRRKRR